MAAPLETFGGIAAVARAGLGAERLRLLPNFTDAPFFVARTDYVLSAPRGFLALFERELKLKRLKLPLPLPRFTHRLVYHQRQENDPEHTWLRQSLAKLA